MSCSELRLGFRLSMTAVLVLAFALSAFAVDETRLTTDGKLKRDPQYTDGGKSIVYVEQASPTLMRLMRFDAKSKKDEPFHKNASKSEFEPSVSRDGRYTAFIQGRGNLSLALVIRDNEQKRDAEIKPSGGFCGFRSPCISPDARRVVYSFADGTRQQIYSVDTKAGDRRRLTDSSGVNNWPSFSPDGKRIVFGSSRDGNFELYSMNADGSRAERLTHSRFLDMRPRYSPDGKRIAFVSSRHGNYEIYVMNADGSNVARITRNDERDDFPTWHPDGKRLLFVGERRGRFDLYELPVEPSK